MAMHGFICPKGSEASRARRKRGGGASLCSFSVESGTQAREPVELKPSNVFENTAAKILKFPHSSLTEI